MTIRVLMLVTLVMAGAFALHAWSWGIAVFAGACLPLLACLSVRKFLSRRKALRVVAFSASIALIYLFSHGPCVALLHAIYDGHIPPTATTITRSLYAPHELLLDRRKRPSIYSPLLEQLREFSDGYTTQWRWFGSDIGVFVRALSSYG